MPNESGGKRLRSPSYPYLTLEKAIEFATLFYKKESRHKATPDVAAEHLGYTATSSLGARALSALTKFGLLDAEGLGEERRVWISELGLSIVLDRQEESPDRLKAIQEAALNPKVFRELWERWGRELPSRATMETVLLKEYSFNESALDQFIGNLKDTLEFAGLLGDDTERDDDIIGEDEPTNGGTKSEHTSVFSARKPIGAPTVDVRDITLPLIGGGMAILRVPVPLSEENFDFLVMLLSSMKKALVEVGDTSNVTEIDR